MPHGPDELRALVEEYLDGARALARAARSGGVGALLVAVGGKRVRPVICLATAEAPARKREVALPAACAVELVHTFSLVHDDLPALDDDEERRGQPSTWKRFGEATGDPRRRRAARGGVPARVLVRHAARGARARGGDARDDRRPVPRHHRLGAGRGDAAHAEDRAACSRRRSGCALWAAWVPEPEQAPWRAFGGELGLLFQIVDDILDGDGYVVTHGVDGARASRTRRPTARAPRSSRWTRTRRSYARSSTTSPSAPLSLVETVSPRAMAVLLTGSDPVKGSAASCDDPRVTKKRLDVLLVERGLAESRAQAQALVMAGLVPGYEKPGQQVDDAAELSVERGPAYVSRGGEKLAHALDAPRRRSRRARLSRRRRVDGRLHRRPARPRRRARDRARRRLRPAAPDGCATIRA